MAKQAQVAIGSEGRKKPVLIGIGLVVILIVVVGGFLLLKKPGQTAGQAIFSATDPKSEVAGVAGFSGDVSTKIVGQTNFDFVVGANLGTKESVELVVELTYPVYLGSSLDTTKITTPKDNTWGAGDVVIVAGPDMYDPKNNVVKTKIVKFTQGTVDYTDALTGNVENLVTIPGFSKAVVPITADDLKYFKLSVSLLDLNDPTTEIITKIIQLGDEVATPAPTLCDYTNPLCKTSCEGSKGEICKGYTDAIVAGDMVSLCVKFPDACKTGTALVPSIDRNGINGLDNTDLFLMGAAATARLDDSCGGENIKACVSSDNNYFVCDNYAYKESKSITTNPPFCKDEKTYLATATGGIS